MALVPYCSSHMNASRGNRRTIHKMITTAPSSTVGTDRCSAVTALCHGKIAALQSLWSRSLDTYSIWQNGFMISDKKKPPTRLSRGHFARLSPE